MNFKEFYNKNKKILIIFLVVITIVILVFVGIKIMNRKPCNRNSVEEKIHSYKEGNKITHFIENSLNSLHEINKNLKDNDNSESLQENLLSQKNQINEINNYWLNLDLFFKNINPNYKNDFNSIFEKIHNFEHKINSLKQDQNMNDDKKNILVSILTNLKTIEETFRNIPFSENNNINNSVSNTNQNQNEKEIIEQLKKIKELEKNLDDNKFVPKEDYPKYSNLLKIINDSQYGNIKNTLHN
ncbi:MAG: hypothetical protein ACN23H_00185 [Candidatus Phytoplasma vitis]|nr:MAG: hypothetical protein M6G77_02460 [Candidatus Phytoplasma vitis]